MTLQDAPGASGFVHLPPIWIVDDMPVDGLRLRPSSEDVSEAADVVVTCAIGSGVEVHVTRDGLVLFDCSDEPFTGGPASYVLSARLTLANAFLACLHSAVLHVDRFRFERIVVTHSNAVHRRDGTLFVNEAVARALLQHDGHSLSGWVLGGGIHATTSWIPSRHLLSTEALHTAVDRRRFLMNGALEQLRRYELLAKATVAAQEHDFALTLIIGWSLVEQALMRLWREAVEALAASNDGNPTFTPYTRMNIKTVLDLLRTTGDLTDEIYEDFNNLRRSRNAWAHRLAPVDADTAERAIAAAGAALAAADRTPFVMSFRPAVTGFSF